MIKTVDDYIRDKGSRLCIGLDPDPQRFPDGLSRDSEGALRLMGDIIDATADQVCAYKPNLAFFEAFGADGYALLRQTLARIPQDVLVIADAKRGDIGNTAAQYASALFDDLGAGAATVNPLMGHDCVRPFLAHADRVSFLLCLTSNPGADDFLLPGALYLSIARKAEAWNGEHGNVGLVVGATRPEHLSEIRAAAPSLPFLIPGLGAQGGEAEQVVRRGRNRDGEGLVFNVSRDVLYAGKKIEDFAAEARRAACAWNDRINAAFRAA